MYTGIVLNAILPVVSVTIVISFCSTLFSFNFFSASVDDFVLTGPPSPPNYLPFWRLYHPFHSGLISSCWFAIHLDLFWEIDNNRIDDVQVLSAEDNFILDKAQQSVKFIDGHYSLEGRESFLVKQLPNGIASIEVAQAYKENIEKYLKKVILDKLIIWRN